MGLDTVEFVIEVEQKFAIEISDDDAATLDVVGKLAEYICAVSLMQNNKELDPNQVFVKLQDMLAVQYDISKEKILRSSYFVKDLGLD